MGNDSGTSKFNRNRDKGDPNSKHLQLQHLMKKMNEADLKVEAMDGQQGKESARARLDLVALKLQVQILEEEGDVKKAQDGLERANKLEELSDIQPPTAQTKEAMKKLGAELMKVIVEVGVHGMNEEDLGYL